MNHLSPSEERKAGGGDQKWDGAGSQVAVVFLTLHYDWAQAAADFGAGRWETIGSHDSLSTRGWCGAVVVDVWVKQPQVTSWRQLYMPIALSPLMCGYLFFFFSLSLCVSVSGRHDSTSFMLWFFISVILFTFISDKWLNLCLTGSWRPLLTFPHLCSRVFLHLICEVWDVCWRRAAHSLPFQHPIIMAPCGGAAEEINNHQNGKINAAAPARYTWLS